MDGLIWYFTGQPQVFLQLIQVRDGFTGRIGMHPPTPVYESVPIVGRFKQL